MLNEAEILNQVATGLIKRELFSLAGELFETVGQTERALECYRRGHSYRQAVELGPFLIFLNKGKFLKSKKSRI